MAESDKSPRPCGSGVMVVVTAAAVTLLLPVMAQAQETEVEGPPAPEPAASTASLDQEKPAKQSLKDRMFDDVDGKFDVSELLASGGFVPVPVIITEPAVDGGFGLVAQFVNVPEGDPRNVTRRAIAGLVTGNGSHIYGYHQSANAFDGRLSYKFSIGRGKINMETFPSFAPDGVNYTNKFAYGIFASALWKLPDERFSVGPILDFRKIKTTIEFSGDLAELVPEVNHTIRTGALGLGLHYDSRDNKITPTEGVNAFAEAKFNADAFGSDRTFQIFDVDVYAFHRLDPKWRLGVKTELDAAKGSFPIFFSPSIDLRGVQSGRYQGSSALSTEVEVTRQISDRWSVIGFGGMGLAFAGESRLFDNSGAKFSGGAGFRYRIARLLGIDAGMDVAMGPGGAVFYVQFGHSWSTGMD